MRSKLYYIVLIILPTILLFLELFYRNSRGEYFLFSGYDGVYGLLLSSLNMAQFKSPGYFQHPGIIPQIISAVVIKITYLLQGNNSSMVLDTIDRPEFYLSQINITFAILTVIALYILGIVSYKKIGNIFAALFIQLTPFVSTMVVFMVTQNTCETTTIILILLLLGIIISFLNEETISDKKNMIYALIFGVICGLALSNKVSVLPIMIIPLLVIKKIRYKGLFIIIAITTFSILLFSISSEVSRFFNALLRNLFQPGTSYNSGPANFTETSQVISQIKYILSDYFFFFITTIIMLFTLALQFIPRFKNKVRSNKYFLLIVGILIVNFTYILLVVKTQLGYYILPALLFSVVGLFSVNAVISDLFPTLFKKSKYIFLFIIFILLTIPNISILKTSIKTDFNRKKESNKIVKYLQENYSQSIVVSSDFTSSMPTAFYEGLYYSGTEIDNYKSLLKSRYPNYIYFERWSKKFIYTANPELIEKLVNAGTFIYHSVNLDNFNDFKQKIIEVTNKPNSTFVEVFGNNIGEKLYLVTLK